MFFYEPEASATIQLSLRRTLVRSYPYSPRSFRKIRRVFGSMTVLV